MILLSCKANVRVYDAKLGHSLHSPPPDMAASPKRLKKVANLQFATETVWAQNPDSQSTEVYPSHNTGQHTKCICNQQLIPLQFNLLNPNMALEFNSWP